PAFGDAAGYLTPIDVAALPLTVVRAFVIEAPDGAIRGGHAHRSGKELFVRLAGEITIDLHLSGVDSTLSLDATHNALLIAAPVWSRQRYHGPAPRLLVFCDTPYDPRSYVYNSLNPPAQGGHWQRD